MAIQMRQGAYADFDPSKMRAGEWAVSTDADSNKQQIWMCFSPGVVKRMGTVEDFDIEIQILIQEYLDDIAESVEKAQTSANTATTKASESATSAKNAKTSEENAKTYASNASTSATNAKTSEANASSSASKASNSETNAKTSETNASTYATNAKTSETNSKTSETNAKTYATNASTSASNASTSATNAKSSESNSKTYESSAQKYAKQAQDIAESLSGALRPMGTVTFANLPSLSSSVAGDMYNVSDQFTTTSSFKEGAGNVISAGSNIYVTTDKMWDVLAGSPVTGVKGDNEIYYSRGNVNITPTKIGLGNVTNNKQIKGLASGTTSGHVVTFGADGYTVADSGYTIASNVPSNAKFTDTTYSAVTTSANGLMTATDKKLLDIRNNPLGTCATGRATAAKVVTLANFVLAVGTTIAVKFTDTAGTANPNSGDLTLNVNGTGAKNIAYTRNGSKGALTYSQGAYFYNNATRIFTYDGTYWICMDYNADNDTINSAGASNKTKTKMFLVGVTAQNDGITSYSNNNCYIGTDNKLYSGGKLVATNEDLQAVLERVEKLEDMIGYPLEEEETS